MFEYHGWATLQDLTDEFAPGVATYLSQEAFDEIQGLAWSLQSDGLQSADLRGANGAMQFSLAGLRNHRHGSVIDAFKRVAEVAPWSYGVLYVWDDEAPEPEDNRWVAWVMKRGKVTAHPDTFLSPHVGEVEDPEIWDE